MFVSCDARSSAEEMFGFYLVWVVFAVDAKAKHTLHT